MEDHRDLEDEDDDNDQFDEDMDALRRACMISGTNPDDLSTSTAAEDCNSDEAIPGDDDKEEEEDDDYDMKLFQSIQSRFSTPSDPLLPQPLCFLPPPGGFSDDDADEDDDDFETLRAIQKRFASYGNDALKNSPENALEKKEQLHALPVSSEDEASNALCFHRFDTCEEFPDNDYGLAHQSGANLMDQPSASIQWNPTDSAEPSTSQPRYSSFPKAGRVFMDAIKKNRLYQKFLRIKLIHIEAKIEENKKLKERVKILKDFQVNCKKRTGRALSQKKDARVQLVSVKKACSSKDLKVHDRKLPAMFSGPQENSHAANYRMALSKFPLSLHRKNWSELETKNLGKGIRQQFQENVLQNKVDSLSDSGDSRGLGNLDNLLASVKNLNITPEHIRDFLPKVKWDQVATLYVVGRSAAECETRWLNFEDPLINQGSWTAQEDRNLLAIAKNNGINNWFHISVSLGTNRTPFQCLARYQRSLNVSILKSEWTEEDDAKLRSAVELYGECDWQAVASSLDGWTGTQCSNRWKKTLHPAREKVGRWTKDEDKRLTVAQKLFGTRNWKKIAQFVPGRTEVQCRERWVNSLDPSLNWDKWTLEEDLNLRKAIEEHGYCWTKVAAALPRRTDNMCRRRWKRLLPHEVPLLQAARRMQKAVFICNFVDRESERPTIGPNDFPPSPKITAIEDTNHSKEQSGKSRRRVATRKKKTPSCETAKGRRGKKSTEKTKSGSDKSPPETTTNQVDALKTPETTTNQVENGSDKSPPETTTNQVDALKTPETTTNQVETTTNQVENGMDSIEGQNGSSSLIQTQWASENGKELLGSISKKRPRKTSYKTEELVANNRDQTAGSLHGNGTSLSKKRGVSAKQKDGGKTQATDTEQFLNVVASTSDHNTGSFQESSTSSARKRRVSLKWKDDEKTSATNTEEPLNVIASNGDHNTGSLQESSTLLAKRRRVSLKRKDGVKTHTTNLEEPLNLIASNGDCHTGSIQESRTLAKKRKVLSKQEDCGEVHATKLEPLKVSLAYGNLLLGKHTSSVDLAIPPGTNSEEIHSVGNDGSAAKKSSDLKQYSRRKKNTKLINVVPAPFAKDGENSTLNSLACILSSTSEKIKPLAKVCEAMKESESIDEDVGVPKASFVRDESEKRSLNPEIKPVPVKPPG